MTESEARSIVESEAASSGARVLWWGRPAAGRLALQSLPVAIFGISFGGFAAFWIWGAAGGLSGGARLQGGMMLFPLFGLPFLLIGLGMILSPLFAALGAWRTLYAVTDTGILIVRAGRWRRVERHPLPRDGELQRTERADGRGDLVVGRVVTTGSKGRTLERAITFVGIPDVRGVERIVGDAARGRPDSGDEYQPPSTPAPAVSSPGAAAPAQPFGHRHPGGSPQPYRVDEPRRLPAALVAVVAFAIGFGAALALARAGRLPIGDGSSAAPPAPCAETGVESGR